MLSLIVKILVTGGSGFIGSNIRKECEKIGWETISLDLVQKKESETNVKGSIEDFDLLLKLTKDVDIVFHEAAVTSPPEFESVARSSFQINVNGTLNVLTAAVKGGVKKVVLASSSAVYGDINVPGKEDMMMPAYGNLYPLTKSINEQTASYFSRTGNLETVCLRYFNTYGLGENSKGPYTSVISKFIEDLKASKTPVIFGNGSQRRDFVYVDDVAKANVLAARNGKSGEIYNVGTGKSTQFKDIYRIVSEEMGKDIEPAYKPIPYNSYQIYTQADPTKSMEKLEFKTTYSIRDGVQKMLFE